MIGRRIRATWEWQLIESYVLLEMTMWQYRHLANNPFRARRR